VIDTLINIVHVYTSRFVSKRSRWRRSTKIFRQRTFKEVSDNETSFGEYELYIIQFSRSQEANYFDRVFFVIALVEIIM